MQNSSEGGHEEKINPETGCSKNQGKNEGTGRKYIKSEKSMMQNSSEGGHQEKINPGENALKKISEGTRRKLILRKPKVKSV